MIDKNNCMDQPTTAHHCRENVVDFELLWRCISKIQNQFGMATYTKKIDINNKKYNYSELTNIFAMFIVVKIWSCYWTSFRDSMVDVLIFTSWSRILFVLCIGYSTKNIQKIKKLLHKSTSFFIKVQPIIAKLA